MGAFLMGFDKSKPLTKFELASFSAVAEIIKASP